MKKINLINLRFVWILLLIIVLDQFSKYLALKNLIFAVPLHVIPFFNLYLTFNQGAAFSFLGQITNTGWQNWLFAVMSLIISCLIIVWILKLPRTRTFVVISLTIILGGAISNLIDRIVYGFVIDFLDVYYGAWHWPTFNIADSSIVIGVCLLFIAELFTGKGNKLD